MTIDPFEPVPGAGTEWGWAKYLKHLGEKQDAKLERERKERAAVLMAEWRAEAFKQLELPPPVGDGANPKKRYGDLKVPVHLVPPALVIGAARAYGEGARRYGAFNWRDTNVEANTYIGAILRHAYAYLDGEDVDPESKDGKLHLEGIAACVGILLDAQHSGKLIDNRPPKGPAPGLLRTPGFVAEAK